MSDFICVDCYFVHKLPDNVPLDVGGELTLLAYEPKANACSQHW